MALREACVTIVGYPRILELVAGRYYADNVLSADSADLALLYQEAKGFPIGLRDLFGAFQIIAVFSRSHSPFVKNLRKISTGRVVAIPPFPPRERGVHMVDHLLSLPRSLGMPVHCHVPRLHLLQQDRAKAIAFLRDQGISPDAVLIAMHPGSGSRAKAWPLRCFLDLANRLTRAYQAEILFIMGPAEEEIRQFLRPIGSKPVVVLDGLPLSLLAAILERCSVFVGNDSGITHMVAALGVAGVVIFGPSDPVMWAPRVRELSLIRRGLPCSPCDRETMLRCQDRRCLQEISVDEVGRAVERIMEKAGQGSCYGRVSGFIAGDKPPVAKAGQRY
jgi:ADP-heptose:LPS heptosyltransferase